MLEQSFIFLPGIRERTERLLWDEGIATWDHLLDATSVRGVGRARLLLWKSCVRSLRERISREGIACLKRTFGSRWAWRLTGAVMDAPRYVDIETTESANEITLIGVSDGEFYQAFVRGRNLDRHSLRQAFAGCTCIVTFNGSSFDLPVIERQFPGLLPEAPHLDCRHVCAQAGLSGGLKRIEADLGIRRPGILRDTDGTDAILLWYRHLMGDPAALDELIDYNAADCLNLRPLLETVVPVLWQHVRHGLPISLKA